MSRNPKYVFSKDVRQYPIVRKNMRAYRDLVPTCEWTQKEQWDKYVNVHHWIPVSKAPEYAHCPWNLFTLASSKGKIHQAVGHNGNFRDACYELPRLLLEKRGVEWWTQRQGMLVKHFGEEAGLMPHDVVSKAYDMNYISKEQL